MSSEVKIKDLSIYTSEMEKGMKDKLFFLQFLDLYPRYNFVDYGCANGKTLEAIANARAELQKPIFAYDNFWGYDKSEMMVNLAKSQWQGPSLVNVNFTSHFDDVVFSENSVLILSSVLHEVYSYAENKFAIDAFWKTIFSTGAEYIVIRDMCWSSDMDRPLHHEAKTQFSMNLGCDFGHDFITNFNKESGVKRFQIEEFEAHWGSIFNVKNFIHLLLKYKYLVNWERELLENYFAIQDTELFHRIQNSNYNITYLERFQLPTIYDFTHVNSMFTLNDNTHIKIILKKKEN